MCRLLFLYVCAHLMCFSAIAQIVNEQQLIADVHEAKDNYDRINKLGKLSEYYYLFRADKKGDSVLNAQLVEAELSTDKDVVLKTLFGDAITNLPSFSSTETLDKAMAFLQKGLDYARQTQQGNYEALAYIRKASLYRKRGKFDNAIQEATLAFPLLNKGNDSLKTILYLELGDAFLAKGDAVAACTHFNSAYDIAYSLKNIPLQSETHHRYASLYQFLGDVKQAKEHLLESLQLNTNGSNPTGLLQDYIDLCRMTDEKAYLDKAIALSDSQQFLRYQLLSKRIMFYYLMVIEKNSDVTLRYLNSNQDLKQTFLNQGQYAYNWAIGNTYRYGHKPDSAIRYYLNVEPQVLASFDNANKYDILNEIGTCYLAMNQPAKAISYFEKALAYGQTQNNVSANANISSQLSGLYAQTGDYKRAYDYNLKYVSFKDTMNLLSKEREVALLDVDRINKKHATDLQEAAANDLRRRNLQYMGISFLTAFLFIALLVFGMFPVSKMTVRMLNFFSFICLFEFIILLIDTWLHNLAHGEPLKIWLAKIFVIALLLPLHHTLEHVAIKFLASEKLMRFRRSLSLKRLLPSKKTVQKIEENLEEGTLV